MSRLADIYKAQKSRGKGLGSTLKERAKEKFDPRQYLNQSGLLVASLPGLKKYTSDTRIRSKVDKDSTNVLAPEFISALKIIDFNTSITAKNTMFLPKMAKDMNVTKQSLVNIVKLLGGTQKDKAQDFFRRSEDLEREYESKRSLVTKKTQDSKNVLQKTSDGGGLFSAIVSGLIAGIMPMLLKAGLIATTIFGIKKYFEDAEFRETINTFVKEKIFEPLIKIMKDHWEYVVGALALAFPITTLTLIGKGISTLLTILTALDLIPDRVPGRTTPRTPGVPAPAPGTPSSPGGTSGAPGTPGAPGAEKQTPSKTPSKTPTEKPGFLKTPEEKIRERGERLAKEKAGKKATSMASGKILEKFFSGALTRIGAAATGPVGTAWAAAYTAYEILDALSPSEQEVVEDSIAALASIQEDIDDIEANPNLSPDVKKKLIGLQQEKAKQYENKLKKFSKVSVMSAADFQRTDKDVTPVPMPSPEVPAGAPKTTPSPSSSSAGDGNLREMQAKREGGAAGYDAIFGKGQKGGDPSIPQRFGGRNLSQLTIGEALTIGKERGKDNAGAMGKYGFMPSTIKDNLKDAGLTENDLFSAENQEKLYDAMTRKNIATLKRSLGRDPTNFEVDLAHAAGAGGALALLKANPNEHTYDIMAKVQPGVNWGPGSAARKTNPQMNKSVGDYLAYMRGYLNKSGKADVVAQVPGTPSVPGPSPSTSTPSAETAKTNVGDNILGAVGGMFDFGKAILEQVPKSASEAFSSLGGLGMDVLRELNLGPNSPAGSMLMGFQKDVLSIGGMGTLLDQLSKDFIGLGNTELIKGHMSPLLSLLEKLSPDSRTSISGSMIDGASKSLDFEKLMQSKQTPEPFPLTMPNAMPNNSSNDISKNIPLGFPEIVDSNMMNQLYPLTGLSIGITGRL